jgi:shikimate kinase
MRNIVLTGFMGSGKSTVGRLVAQMIHWPFVDADEEIIARAGMKIPQIFERDGEAGFRRLESEVCRSLAQRERVVIATGGGMLVNPDNRATMLATGLVVALRMTPEDVMARIGSDSNRPMLKTDWRALMAKRQAAYDAVPYQLDTHGRRPHDVAQEIVTLWQNQNVST